MTFENSAIPPAAPLPATTRDFLEAVAPFPAAGEEGFVNIHRLTPGRKGLPGKSCRTMEEAMTEIARLQGKGRHIYFCLSRQRYDNGNRKKAYAIALRAIWLDIDLGSGDKKYDRLAMAIAMVLRFCMALGIPRPSFMVNSGGGLHVYWISDRALTVEDWQPFADALKNAALAHGLKIDAGLTTDCARVLRVPGTLNYKYDPPRQVQVLNKYSTFENCDFSTAFALLLKDVPAGPATHKKTNAGYLGPVHPSLAHLPIRQLGGGIESRLVPLDAVKAKCAWLRHVHDTGGADQPEPLWWDSLRAGMFLIDGKTRIHEFSNKHLDYNFDATEAKFDGVRRAKEANDFGYPLCQTICDHGSEQCKTCPHLAAGGSPLHPGLQQPKSEKPGGSGFFSEEGIEDEEPRVKHDAASIRKAMEEAREGDVVATFVNLTVAAGLNGVEQEGLRQLARKLSGTGLKAIDAMFKAARREQAKQDARRKQARQAAERQDPRPLFRAPLPDEQFKPQMLALNGIIGSVTATRPPARNIDGVATRVRKLPVPNMHAFTPAEANVEPEENSE